MPVPIDHIVFESVVSVIIAFIVSWFISAFFIWIAAKIVTGKRATFGRALVAALLGPVVFFIFYAIFAIGLSFLIGIVLANLIAILISIFVLSWFYGSIFRTSILGGFLIAVLVVVVTFIIGFLVTLILGVSLIGFHSFLSLHSMIV